MKPGKKILFLILTLILVGGVICFLFLPLRIPPVERIVLITLDTLRADHLGCYGYPRPTSPFIDSLARKSIFFNRAFAPMPSTVPSHAALFTSLYPAQINVLKNGHRLSNSFFTLAEALKERQFRTAAFVSTHVQFTSANLDQGFDEFNQPPSLPPPQPSSRLRPPYRPAGETIAAVLAWLERQPPDEKFFLWIHLFDPHVPFVPPQRFIDSIIEPNEKEKGGFVKFLLDQQHIDADLYDYISDENLAQTVDLSPYGNKKGNKIEAMLRNINAYDGEVRFVDRELERFYNYFRQKGYDTNALLILTADHGEGLGNHYWLGHGKHLYNEAIHVPLIIHFFSGRFGRKTINEVVELIDIFPTVAQLVGIQLDEGLEGVSLLPLFSKIRRIFWSLLPGKRLAFSQRREYSDSLSHMKLDWMANFEAGEKYALFDGKYKYIHRTEGDDEFYDIIEDPYEVYNLAGTGGRAEKKLKKTILKMLERIQPLKDSQPESVIGEALEELRTLGYLQ